MAIFHDWANLVDQLLLKSPVAKLTKPTLGLKT